jgi:hypothetical protein
LFKPFFRTRSLPQNGHFRATKVITSYWLAGEKTVEGSILISDKKSNAIISGHYRNTKGNSIIKVFPLQKTCGDVFEYKDNGKIEGIGTDAVDTINVLRLDCEKLNATRYEMVYVFLNEMSNVTSIEFDMWIDDYLKPDANGHFRPFWSTVKSMAKEYHP